MEQVLVVDRAAFFGGAWPQGFTAFATEPGQRLLADLHRSSRFVDRTAAEQDPGWKQLIPYCVIERPGAVFCVQRRSQQSEQRLHGRWSIGLGGHINDHDGAGPHADAAAFFLAALWRELTEELHLERDAAPDPVFVGLLNDDRDSVGSVHAGLVYRLVLPATALAAGADLQIREISKMAGGFRSLVELQTLWQDPDRFESWSRHLLHVGSPNRKATFPWRGIGLRSANAGEESDHG